MTGGQEHDRDQTFFLVAFWQRSFLTGVTETSRTERIRPQTEHRCAFMCRPSHPDYHRITFGFTLTFLTSSIRGISAGCRTLWHLTKNGPNWQVRRHKQLKCYHLMIATGRFLLNSLDFFNFLRPGIHTFWKSHFGSYHSSQFCLTVVLWLHGWGLVLNIRWV